MPRLLPVLTALVVLGWLAAEATATPAAADGARLRCRTFPVPLDGDGFDTDDATQPIGAWVHEGAAGGWQLHSVQLAIGQKTTGYAQGYQQVCLSPR